MKLFLYFSGTGNTRYVAYKFSSFFKDIIVVSVEDDIDFIQLICDAEEITLCYPIYTSMLPKIIDEFLDEYMEYFQMKTVNTIVTQMMFSGDGANLALRKIRKMNIATNYSLHIAMPNNISDVSFLKIQNEDKTRNHLQKVDIKLSKLSYKVHRGSNIKQGRRIYSRFLGYFLQRMYGPWFHKTYSKKWKVTDSCILCNKCVKECPVDNLYKKDNKIYSKNDCIVCYRCVNICPTNSIHIISKTISKNQYYLHKRNY